jgi:uncharacterized membrane protein
VWDCLLWLLAGVVACVCLALLAYVLFVGWLMARLDRDEW